MTETGTATVALLSWLDRPHPGRGIRFARPGDEWDHWSYADLAERARSVASGLQAHGVAAGDVVSAVHPSSPGLVALLFGTLLAGATPSLIAPPLTFQDRGRYDDHVVGLLRAARPALVVTGDELAARVGPLAAAAGRPTVALGALLASAPGAPEPRPVPATALVQFTSGTSGRARGIRIPLAALEANLAQIRAWLEMDGTAATASWLPAHHDMGLIGCLLTPIVDQSDLFLLQPEQFVRTPTRYVRCFGAGGACLTAMPAFGLDYIVRRVRPAALAGLDLSGWRAVIVGAERVPAPTLEAFAARLEPYGFDRRALLPAYGLAEATLAVTGSRLREPWRSTTATTAATTPVVGCGRPLPPTRVTVVDDGGRAVPDGHVGEIVVAGPTIGAGYLGDGDGPSSTAFAGGTLRTGDAGFVDGGELFVVGRMGDSLKVRGRTLFAADVDAELLADGGRAGTLATILGVHGGEPTAVVVIEKGATADVDRLRERARRHTEGATCVVCVVARGTIPTTSSGKPRRRELWSSYTAGTLGR